MCLYNYVVVDSDHLYLCIVCVTVVLVMSSGVQISGCYVVLNVNE